MPTTINRPAAIFSALAVAGIGMASLLVLGGDTTTVVGFYETVSTPEFGMDFVSKLDTGADTTSVHANILNITGPADGEQLVTFQLVNNGEVSHPVTRDITSYQLLDSRVDCADQIRRPKVMMDFDIGGRLINAEVSLADRSGLSTDLLVGRNIMTELGMTIDPSKEYLITRPIPQPK